MFGIGIIGCGKIAQVRHIPEYNDNPDAKLVAFYDLNTARAKGLAEQYGGRAYESVEALLADPNVDAVSVCSGKRQPCGNHGGGAGGGQACAVRKADGDDAGGLRTHGQRGEKERKAAYDRPEPAPGRCTRESARADRAGRDWPRHHVCDGVPPRRAGNVEHRSRPEHVVL